MIPSKCPDNQNSRCWKYVKECLCWNTCESTNRNDEKAKVDITIGLADLNNHFFG